MLLAVAVLLLCLLAILQAVSTVSELGVVLIAGIAAALAVAFILGYGPRRRSIT